MLKLTIGIVNWNTKDLLSGCLNSIFKQKTNYKYKVIVVDNNSIDGTIELIKKNKKIKLIINEENLGMAYGLNQIISKSNSEYFLFLHPDTKLNPNTLENMIAYLDKNHEIGIAGCKLIYPNGKNFASAHKFPTLSALALESLPMPKKVARTLNIHGLYMKTMNYDKTQNVDIIASACIFIRKKCFEDIGFFDERFTNWIAEWDLCKRAKDKGWKIKYVPIAEVVHYEGQSEINGNELEYKKYAYLIADRMLNSLFLFYKKHYPKMLPLLKTATIFGLLGKSLLYTPFIAYPKKSKDAKARINNYFRTIKSIATF